MLCANFTQKYLYITHTYKSNSFIGKHEHIYIIIYLNSNKFNYKIKTFEINLKQVKE